MVKKKQRSRKEILALLDVIGDRIDSDPEIRKMAEEFHKEHGTLTPDDLKKVFTI